jgi:phage shock protein A
VSWARDAVDALRKIVLVEERVTQLSEQVKSLATKCEDMNQRLARLEGKFELLEQMSGARRKRLPPA